MEGLGSAVFMLIFMVLPAVLMLWGAWHGLQRAGYSGAWALILLVPLVNIIMLYVFAFSTWPIESRVPRADERFHR